VKFTDKQLKQMASIFYYKNLVERYRVMEKYFDIQEGDTVIDCGSFSGDMLNYFSKKVGKTGKVYSIEALPSNVQQIKRLCRYQIMNNVEIIPIALWNKKEKIKFYLSKYPNAGSGIKEFRKVSEDYIEVDADALDNLNIENPKWLWSNIEGAEVKALVGAEDILKNNDMQVCISTHKVNDEYSTTRDVWDYLEYCGYKCEYVKNHGMWVYGKK